MVRIQHRRKALDKARARQLPVVLLPTEDAATNTPVTTVEANASDGAQLDVVFKALPFTDIAVHETVIPRAGNDRNECLQESQPTIRSFGSQRGNEAVRSRTIGVHSSSQSHEVNRNTVALETGSLEIQEIAGLLRKITRHQNQVRAIEHLRVADSAQHVIDVETAEPELNHNRGISRI